MLFQIAVQVLEEERETEFPENLLIVLALFEEETSDSWNAFRRSLPTMEERRRPCCMAIPVLCLHHPKWSSWSQLNNAKIDQAMITVTGFEVKSFDYILKKFEPLFFDCNTPHTRAEMVRSDVVLN